MRDYHTDCKQTCLDFFGGQILEQNLLIRLPIYPGPYAAGPDKGGPHGPYRQSERTEIYNGLVDELVQKGMAFPCFCSDEEIEQSRKDAERKNLPPVYRGKWANASAEVLQPLHPFPEWIQRRKMGIFALP